MSGIVSTSGWNPKEPAKYTREWRRDKEILFGVSYQNSMIGKTMTLEVYDKTGNVRSRIKLDERMMRDLRQDIDMCLGDIREEEDD